MITGIVEILRQVDDEENRRRIVAGLTRKLRGEGISLDRELFALACGLEEK
jgi:thymidine kinase